MPLKPFRRGKIWHYRGTIAGRRLRGSTGAISKEIAQRVILTKEQTAWKGHLDGPSAVLTFAQATIMYREAHKTDRYVLPLLNHWRDTPVKDMTGEAIRGSSFQLYPGVGPATRNRQVIVPTQAIINHAAELGKCQHIKVKRFPTVRKVKTPATWAWVEAFMASAKNPHIAGLACFMFLTGARITQALAVTWKDVDFQERKVTIKATLKGDDDRAAHMPPELIAAFANIPGKREGHVFQYRSRGNCRTQWDNTIKRAGIKPLSYHSCRHGFATGLLDQGVNPVTVAKRGGWKSPQHVFATYGHDIAEDEITDVLTGPKSTQQKRKFNVAG